MAATEKKIADLVAFTTPADGDLLPVVDVSDTAQSDDGSTKKITRANFLGTLFSIAADTGTDLAILPLETFSILGGTGIDSVASATRKITLNIDATVATLAGAQTLTNKTINSDDNTLTNVVSLAGAQTLTNKVIDGDTNTLQDIASTALKEAFFRGRYQSDTTNSAPTGLTVQFGWGQIQGDDTSTIGETATFPTAFSSAPVVVAIFAGVATSAGTSISDYTAVSATLHSTGVYAISTTGFSFRIWRASGTLTSSNYHAYTWIAIGTV